MFFQRFDRYVLTTAILSIMVCVVAFIGLYIVVDAFGRLDDFIRELDGWKPVLSFMVNYYSLHLPLIFVHAGPFAVLMGLLFTLVRLQKHNELLAAKACGVSVRRLMAPLLGLALTVTCLMYANQQWLIPLLADDIERSEKMIVRQGKRERSIDNLFLKDSFGTWFVVGRYNTRSRRCSDTWIISTVGGERNVRHAAEAILIDTGLRVAEGADLSNPVTGPSSLTDIVIPTDLSHDDFIARAGRMRLRSYTNLLWLHQRRPSALDVEVALHRSLAFPLVALMIPLIGMSILFVKEGLGAATAVGIAIFVTFGYFVLDDVCSGAAVRGLMSAIAGGWAPIGIYSAGGLYLFTRIRT